MGANAQTSVPAFTAGQVLTAAQVTGINTGIPVFASSTERDAAFGGTGEKTLAEGQMAYLEDTNATQYYDGSSWAAIAGGKILQVVQTVKTDHFTTTSTSLVDVTGFSVSITPSSATSKVLIIANYNISNDTNLTEAQLLRDSTEIYKGTDAGATNLMTSQVNVGDGITRVIQSNTDVFLDSPSTTSATTYKIQIKANTGTTAMFNRSGLNANNCTASSITAMEVSA